MNSVQTGSQVIIITNTIWIHYDGFTYIQISNIIFSKTVDEFVTSMGLCQDNLVVWKYPELDKIQVINSHSSRVLYMSQSPEGDRVVTGAGDETLKFWNVFPQVTFVLSKAQTKTSF